jgi:hypothetical protein
MTLAGLVAFIVLGLLFELLIFQNLFGELTRFVLPALIIGAGAVWVWERGRREEKPKRDMALDAARGAAHSSVEDPILADLNKRKNNLVAAPPATAGANGAPAPRPAMKGAPSPDIDPDLRRKIDEALAEDDPPTE